MTDKVYTHEQFNAIVNNTILDITRLQKVKGGEYAGDVDQLSNFRRNGKNLGLAMEQIWAVYAGKHWDAISQYVKDIGEGKTRERMESISGRADDLIVYLMLFKAMVDEKGTA